MAMNLPFKSFRARLVFSFLMVTMLFLITVVCILYFQRSESIRSKEFTRLQVIRDLKVKKLSAWLEERQGDLQVCSHDMEIRALEDVLTKDKSQWNEDDHNTIDTARSLLQRYVDHYDAYHELFIVNAKTHKVAVSNVRSREGKDKSDYPYVNEPMRTRSIFIQDIYNSKTEGKPAMAFSAPIFCKDHDGEHIIGVLVARANLEHVLYPLLQERLGSGATGETLIVNKDVVAVNELRWHEDAPLNLKIKAEPAVNAAAGRTGIVETEDYRGEMVLAAYTYIPEMRWGFVAKRDLAEVNAPIRAMMRDMAIIIFISGIAVFIVSFLLARQMAQPIRDMSRIVHKFSEGDLQARCSTEGTTEISALGSSFNNMARTLALQIEVQRGGSGIADAVVAATTMKEFAAGLLEKLMEVTGSNLAAFYLLDKKKQRLDRVYSIGLTHDDDGSFDAKNREGELGRTLQAGKIVHHKNIGEDTVFTHRTTAGIAIPKEIVTVPLTIGYRIRAIVTLGTLSAFSEAHLQILQLTQLGLSTAFATLAERTKTEKMAAELGDRNEQLAALNEELKEQTEELQEQAEELEAQREQVAEANRLKSEFLANMSHELRTPLNSVMALSQLMLSRGVGAKPESDAEHLRIIERNGRNLLNLINEILDLSKIEAGHMEIHCTEFDLRDLVDESLATMRPLIEENGLDLEINMADIPRMRSDEERIGQVLVNLLANAIKFTDQGTIGINVTSMDKTVHIAVSDTGIGISDHDLPHIFEEFRQVDGSTTRQYEGTGLGLAICQKITRLLGGTISAISRMGEGSTFTVSLPLNLGDYQSMDVERLVPVNLRTPLVRMNNSDQRENKEEPLVKPVILVVEDDEVAVMQVRTILEETGYEVVVTRNGSEALESLHNRVPDGVILDLMMPGMNGFDLLEQIRSAVSTENLPVLVLSAKELTSEECSRLSKGNIHQLIRKGDVERGMLIHLVREMMRGDDTTLREGRVQETAATDALKEPSSRAQSEKILIVEDNPDNLVTVRAILDDLECEYIIARNGEEAVEQALHHHPGLILMDIQLPRMSGTEATSKIRSNAAFAKTPIVAMTAKAMKGDREEIMAAGCNDYVTKPLDAILVKQIVRKWLGNRESIKR